MQNEERMIRQKEILKEYQKQVFKRNMENRKIFVKKMSKTFVFVLIGSFFISNAHRFYYYLDYDLDVLNPRVSKYHTRGLK